MERTSCHNEKSGNVLFDPEQLVTYGRIIFKSVHTLFLEVSLLKARDNRG